MISFILKLDAQKILTNAYKNQSIKGDGNEDVSAKIEMVSFLIS